MHTPAGRVRPAAVCRGLLDALEASEGRRRRRHRDTTPDALVVTVSDNGIGTAALGSRQEPALGVMGMRERAQAMGGMVEISGMPGRGTHVCVTLPLRATAGGR